MRTDRIILMAATGITLAGCHTDMWVQPKTVGYKTSDMFADGRAARPRVPGTVAAGKLKTDRLMYAGRNADGSLATALPPVLTIDGKKVDTKADLELVLKRGKDRFDIFCSHCHGKVGDGTGMITQRGLSLVRTPATYHTDRLRKMPIGHFFDVATNGFGVMLGHLGRMPEAGDRWAVAAYIRALQLSRFANPADVPADAMAEAPKPGETTHGAEGGSH